MEPRAIEVAGAGAGGGEREMTLEEWGALDEDEPGELVDGRLEEEEVADAIHELCVVWLAHALTAWLASAGGVVLGSEMKFAVRPRRGRKPDLTVYLAGSRLPRQRGVSRRPPDVAVEVLSPRPRDVRRDRIEKLGDYAAFGVRWYWILDPAARTLEILERVPDGLYRIARSVSDGRLADVPGCEGLVLDLDALWARIDALPAEEEGG